MGTVSDGLALWSTFFILKTLQRRSNVVSSVEARKRSRSLTHVGFGRATLPSL